MLICATTLSAPAVARNVDAKEALTNEASRVDVPAQCRLKEEQVRQASRLRFGHGFCWIDADRLADELPVLLIIAGSCFDATNRRGGSGSNCEGHLKESRQLQEDGTNFGGPRPPKLGVFDSAASCSRAIAQQCS